MGAGGERLPAARRPDPEPGGHGAGRGELREVARWRRSPRPAPAWAACRWIPGNLPNDPAAFARFEQAQNQLSGALSRLLVVVEKYPELKANQNFRDLQAQLEGTENRIAVERMRYNEKAQEYNTHAPAASPPRSSPACSASARRPTSRPRPGAEQAPQVNFNFGSPRRSPAVARRASAAACGRGA